MERRGFLISLFLLKLLLCCGGYWKASSCLDWERKALTSFRKALNDPSNRLSSWDDASDCCNWTGITCNTKTRYVVHLDCSGLGLSGSINPSLLEPKHLRYLNLSYNAFNGIPIPELLGSIKELKHLDLSDAGFSGRIPHQLGNLSKLISLKLSSFPDHTLSAKNLWWLRSLPSLKYLNMSYVNLSMATDDWVHVMNKCPSLIELRLPFCDLSYISPTLASVNFTSLHVLDLSYNNFNSRIPNWIANISSLVFLGLAGNQLNGNIPAALGGLSSLKSLDLGLNRLNGTIPTSLGQLSNLSSINLLDNSLTGNVSESLFENLKKLQRLCLFSNSLVFDLHPDWVPPFQLLVISLGSSHLGPQFPAWLRTQKLVQTLDLSNTTISGIMPTWFWDLTPQLLILDLSNNEISGQLPNVLKMQSHGVIDLSSNRFSSQIPCILNGSRGLDFSSNHFSGPIPPNFTSTMHFLKFFYAARNQISGIIPSSIEELKYLVVLDLSRNNITGTIPSRLGNCVALEALDLSNNRLSGGIPSFIEELKYLVVLDLSRNNITSTIPSRLGNCVALEALDLSNNRLLGGIPTSLGLLSRLQTMHLNNNTLSGEVPSSLKNCSSLKALNLGYNNFLGHIPTWIGKSFPALGFLSLRSNMFTGDIPPQLSNLTSLQILDVAQNCLSGTIPQSFENLIAMKNKEKRYDFVSYGRINFTYGWVELYYVEN